MTMTTTTTMTMTHSDCLQRSQKPCPTDVSEGVMTPVKRHCRTVYCPAQRTELETSCAVRWHCLKSKKQKIYTGLCCTKFFELKETERILGFWSTVYPLRDQSPCFTFILSTYNSLASTGIKHGIVQRQELVERLDVRAHGVRWHLLWLDKDHAQEAQRATDSLSKAPSSGNTLWISSSLFDCLVPLMRGTKPTNTKVVWSCLAWRSRLSPPEVGMIACTRWGQCHCADPVSSSQHTCSWGWHSTFPADREVRQTDHPGRCCCRHKWLSWKPWYRIVERSKTAHAFVLRHLNVRILDHIGRLEISW